MAGFDEKFRSMIDDQMNIHDELKPVEQRMTVLKKHIGQAETYLKYKGKKALTDSEQILFTAANTYLKDVMNGRTALPVKAWKKNMLT
jgi:phage gp36-like protein